MNQGGEIEWEELKYEQERIKDVALWRWIIDMVLLGI